MESTYPAWRFLALVLFGFTIVGLCAYAVGVHHDLGTARALMWQDSLQTVRQESGDAWKRDSVAEIVAGYPFRLDSMRADWRKVRPKRGRP